MKWTKKKPTKEGWYWYSKCCLEGTPIETSPCGVILIAREGAFFKTDEPENLLMTSVFSDSFMLVSKASGYFSDEPIAMPEDL